MSLVAEHFMSLSGALRAIASLVVALAMAGSIFAAGFQFARVFEQGRPTKADREWISLLFFQNRVLHSGELRARALAGMGDHKSAALEYLRLSEAWQLWSAAERPGQKTRGLRADPYLMMARSEARFAQDKSLVKMLRFLAHSYRVGDQKPVKR